MAGIALVVGLQDGLEDEELIFDVLALARTPLLSFRNKLSRM